MMLCSLACYSCRHRRALVRTERDRWGLDDDIIEHSAIRIGHDEHACKRCGTTALIHVPLGMPKVCSTCYCRGCGHRSATPAAGAAWCSECSERANADPGFQASITMLTGETISVTDIWRGATFEHIKLSIQNSHNVPLCQQRIFVEAVMARDDQIFSGDVKLQLHPRLVKEKRGRSMCPCIPGMSCAVWRTYKAERAECPLRYKACICALKSTPPAGNLQWGSARDPLLDDVALAR